jgi:hypothetical protein
VVEPIVKDEVNPKDIKMHEKQNKKHFDLDNEMNKNEIKTTDIKSSQGLWVVK